MKLVRLFSTPRRRVVKEIEVEVLSKAKKDHIQVGRDKIQLYEWGEGDRLVMLFHGWESNAGSLGIFVEPLINQGYKIISFDGPAHGKSSGSNANLLYFKKTAKIVIEKYGVPEVAIGHSLGANTIIMVAFEENIVFEKTILIAPLNRLISVFEEMKSILKLPETLFKRFIERFGEIAGYSLETFYFHEYGSKSKLKDVLLLHDKNDRITSYNHAVEMNKNWKETILQPITGSGHYKILWLKRVKEISLNFIQNK